MFFGLSACQTRIHRHRQFVDRQQGLAIGSIEDEQVPRLAAVVDRLAHPAVDPHVGQQRRMDVVHVPDVVADGLEMPLVGAGLQVHRDDAVAEQVLPGTQLSVLRRAAAADVAERVIGHAELGIERPVDPGRAAGSQRAAVARLPGGSDVDRLAVHVGQRSMVPGAIEGPGQAAVARFQGERRAAVAVIGADIDQAVVIDGGDLGDVAERGAAGAGGLHHPGLQSSVLVQRDHAIAAGKRVHLAVADRDAAARAAGVERGRRPLPLGDARGAVDRDDAPARRVEIDDPIDHDGRGLLAGVGGGGRLGRNVRPPYRPQPLDVRLVDLRQRRIALVAQVAAVGGIVLVAGRAAIGERRGGRALAVAAAVAVAIVVCG
jgi:hypothetical protein